MNIIDILLNAIKSNSADMPLNANLSEKTKSNKAPVTLRLSEKSAEFYERQATNMNTTPSSLINMILNTVADSTDAQFGNRYTKTLAIIRERLQLVFDWHSLDVFQVHDLYNLYARNLCKEQIAFKNIEQILDELEPDFIQFVCEFFHISVDWMIGKSERIFESMGSWYLSHKAFCKEVLGYSILGSKPILHFVIGDNISTDEAIKGNEELKTGVYVSYVSVLDGRDVRCYVPYHLERWNYEKCRIRLKMISLFCQHAEKLGISISHRAVTVSAAALNLFNASKLHPSQLPHNAVWYLDDYVDLQLPVSKEVDELNAVFFEYNHSKLVKYMVEADLTTWEVVNSVNTLVPIVH